MELTPSALGLTILCAQGQDIKLDPTKFEMGRNFANKIWNAFNVFGQFMETGQQYSRQRSFKDLDFAEQWMVTRLNQTILEVEEDLARYRPQRGHHKNLYPLLGAIIATGT